MPLKGGNGAGPHVHGRSSLAAMFVSERRETKTWEGDMSPRGPDELKICMCLTIVVWSREVNKTVWKAFKVSVVSNKAFRTGQIKMIVID